MRVQYRRFIPTFLAAVLFACLVASTVAQNEPYVGAWEAENLFGDITSAEMDVLRSKKILFASRSFGLNMRNGLQSLATKNPMHNLLNSYIRYDVFSAGGDLSIIPADVYDTYNFVHFLATYWPHTKRVEELDTLIRTAPHSFWEDIDVAMIYFHYAESSIYGTYTSTMDALRADHPHIEFIYLGSGYMDTNHVSQNQQSVLFNQQIKANYMGQVPIYDMASILSDDGRCGEAYCPEYSTDPAGVHPNTELGQEQMAKGFLVMLREIYFGSVCTNFTPPTVPTGLSGTAVSSSSIELEWSAADHVCGIQQYNVNRDSAFIDSTRYTNYTDTGLVEGTSYAYTVCAVTPASITSAYSTAVTVWTLADTNPPTIVRAEDTRYSTQVTVVFSEELEQTSAETTANYLIDQGISVLSASLSTQTVVLTTSEMTGGTKYTLSVSNVMDTSSSPNVIAPNSQATFTYREQLYPDDPIAYWNFDGTLNDLTTNQNHGVWVDGGPTFGEGLLGQALAQDGTTNAPYVRIAHDAVLDGMDTVSISVWAKKNDAGTGGQLFKKHVVYDLRISGNGVDGYLWNPDTTFAGQATFSTTVPGIADTAWHHYCMVFDGSNLLAFVDGVEEARTPQTGPVRTRSSSPIYLGKVPWGSYLTFPGAIDEMKIFDRALETNEVAALSAAGFAGNADYAAVRALLDANGLTAKQVSGVAVFENDRVVNLHIQEGGVTQITSHVGQLTELRVLHCYGDRTLGHPLLTSVAPQLGNCLKLEELLLNQNDLTGLPEEITNLKDLNILSLGENELCALNVPLQVWADTYDPDWRETQDCRGKIGTIFTISSAIVH